MTRGYVNADVNADDHWIKVREKDDKKKKNGITYIY